MKVEIECKRSYVIKRNNKEIGEFVFESEWNGLIELSGENGMVVISLAPGESLLDIMDSLMDSNFQSGSREANVIKASPDIIAKLVGAKEAS